MSLFNSVMYQSIKIALYRRQVKRPHAAKHQASFASALHLYTCPKKLMSSKDHNWKLNPVIYCLFLDITQKLSHVNKETKRNTCLVIIYVFETRSVYTIESLVDIHATKKLGLAPERLRAKISQRQNVSAETSVSRILSAKTPWHPNLVAPKFLGAITS